MYIEQQNNSTVIDIIFLKKWRDFGPKQELKKKTNVKMTNYLLE